MAPPFPADGGPTRLLSDIGRTENGRAEIGQSPSSAFQVPDRPESVRYSGKRPLREVDPIVWDLIEQEKGRQWRGIELIASENFTSQAVMEALGSALTNKYAEGLPGARYYPCNQIIDRIENLARERALAAFHLDDKQWGVNVQPYSCTSANFAVFTGLLQPKDRIMGLDLSSGGHASHGYQTSVRGRRGKVSATSVFFETMSYRVNPATGLIDMDRMESLAMEYRPSLLICGGSAYPREWDYQRFREVANACGAILMCDMAHVAGLVAAQVRQNNAPKKHLATPPRTLVTVPKKAVLRVC